MYDRIKRSVGAAVAPNCGKSHLDRNHLCEPNQPRLTLFYGEVDVERCGAKKECTKAASFDIVSYSTIEVNFIPHRCLVR